MPPPDTLHEDLSASFPCCLLVETERFRG